MEPTNIKITVKNTLYMSEQSYLRASMCDVFLGVRGH
jgi:hypothetical protein